MGERTSDRSATVLVVGAGRPLGLAIVEELRTRGRPVIATLRRPNPKTEVPLRQAGAEVRFLDIHQAGALAAGAADVSAVIMLPSLPASGPAASRAGFAPDQRCVFFSSHNAAVDFTTTIYDEFRAAEAALRFTALAWTILRPTMIYGFPGDRNVSRLIATFKKMPVVFAPGRGAARQQPVYYRDLAKVAVAVLTTDSTLHEILEVGGPDKLTLRDLYRMAANGKPVISLPLAPLMWLANGAERVGLPFPLSTHQLARVGVDRLVTPPQCLPEEHRPRTPFSAGIAQLLAESNAED